ncbi:threonine ammonia-lyase [Solicola gregarius]|uniref:threonine ammonia-lyase n=1 Tax=Solicola gregarius TaxID=2908642 RepID=A0AA46TL91_9ACTN|nr:pyridoxal-phosphate dependent enzyme [Solicola gregarius]UYM07389.1 pyridoxal-phosphate dependent enzyme [Solicola gregarius]
MQTPTIADVLEARRHLRPHLGPTPARSFPGLDRAAGTSVLVKHENTNPTSAFKVRGGLNLIGTMPSVERRRGVVGYSTGNHAQSLAYAARTFDVPCTIVMPDNPNPTKAQAVRDLGAELVEAGQTFDDCRSYAESIAQERGMRLVSAANERPIIAGVATLYLELIEDAPDLDAIVVPVGSGSGAAAACLVAESLAPSCRVVAVQSSASPAAYESWRAGEIVEPPNRTRAEGLATGSGFELPQHIFRERLAEFVLVDDDQIRDAQRIMLHEAHTLAEGAGAAALAAVLAYPDSFRDQRVALVCTGANASAAEIGAAVVEPVMASSVHG